MERFNLLLSDEIANQVRKISDETGVSYSHLAREAFKFYFKHGRIANFTPVFEPERKTAVSTTPKAGIQDE